MPAKLTLPGYWLVSTPNGVGIVHVNTASLLQGGGSKAAFLGRTESDITKNINGAVGQVHDPRIYEMPGGIGGIIDKAVQHGAAIFSYKDMGIQADPIPVYGGAALLAIGGLLALPFVGAGAVVGAEGAAGAGAAGAAGAEGAAGGGAAAAGGAAAGGGATAAAKSVAGKIAGSSAGKIAGAVAIGSLFSNPTMWKGIGLVLAGAILIILALTQLTGVSLPIGR